MHRLNIKEKKQIQRETKSNKFDDQIILSDYYQMLQEVKDGFNKPLNIF